MKKFTKMLLFALLVMILAMMISFFMTENQSDMIVCPRCDYETTISNFKCKHCGYLIPNFVVDANFFEYRVIDIYQLEEDREYFKKSEN